MSAIEDVTQGIAAAVSALEEAATATEGAAAAAAEGLNAVAMVGVESDVEAWSSLKEQLDGILAQVAGATQSAEEVQNQVNAIAEGT